MKRVTPYSCYNYGYYIVYLMVILLVYKSSANDYYQEVHEISRKIAKTITVDLNGLGNYKTVQSAVNAIPNKNQNWIRILIKKGIYNEKVMIPKDKGYIYMQGAGIEKTIISYNDPRFTSFFNDTSSTFTAYSDNIIISRITFKNTYNIGLTSTSLAAPIKPALAARMVGDKYLVIDSSFDGFQDTLYDCIGRHYYRRCVISGGIDFIYGYAQSIFEGCTLNLTMGIYAPPGRTYGTITAHGRQSPNDSGGFVFKDCTLTGRGKALLGRAWEPYARVIFYRSTLPDTILPIGWDAWNAKGQEGHTTFVEYNCTGAGADTSARVPWLKKASTSFLSLTSVSSINQEGWLDKLPIKFR